jgi:membrane-associated phospholipid phosphatase
MSTMNAFRAILALLLATAFVPRGALAAYPYELDATRELVLTGAGISLNGLAYVLNDGKRPVSEQTARDARPSQVNAFDRAAAYEWSPESACASDWMVAAIYAAPGALLAGARPRGDVWCLALMYGETMIITFGIAGTVKGALDRPRPYVYNPDVPLEKKTTREAMRSFYSQHTASAFAAAVFTGTVYADYYPDSASRYAVWTAALSAASAAGYLRFRAGRHYPSDIIAGACMGSLAGWLIPALHRGGAPGGVALVPLAGAFNGAAAVRSF